MVASPSLNICFLLVVAHDVFGNYDRWKAATHPDHPGECWIEGQAVPIKGEIRAKNACALYGCDTSENILTCPEDCKSIPECCEESVVLETYYIGCTTIDDVPDYCMLIGLDSAPFPECCPRPTCPTDM